MALYAFDGTWQENTPSDEKDTNVVRFYEAYEGEKHYFSGVGTRFGWLGRIWGGLTGAGGKTRIEEALEALETTFYDGDEDIDIIGFSRGAALALDFANHIARQGVAGQKPVIRFIGLWDVVPSFGIPGNDVNLGYVFTLPTSVEKCFHAMALDERRRNFKVQRVVTTVEDADAEGRVYEVWFRGVHADVGGGNRNPGLSSTTLYWMYRQALRCDLPIAEAVAERQKLYRDPEARIGRNVDFIQHPWRPIPWTDVVHDSVRYRENHNNPPVGLKVVDDDGRIQATGFQKT
ncbi:MAG TPA: DUF2235 domain-containing protein [Gammaproteobacteria bacterium]|nr:DUF2235 domain-containing protein [Gammaproteobacteria bacterium]